MDNVREIISQLLVDAMCDAEAATQDELTDNFIATLTASNVSIIQWRPIEEAPPPKAGSVSTPGCEGPYLIKEGGVVTMAYHMDATLSDTDFGSSAGMVWWEEVGQHENVMVPTHFAIIPLPEVK